MQHVIRLGGLLILGLALIVPTFAGDAKKGTKKKDADVEKADDKGKTDDLSDSKEEKKTTKKGTKKGKGEQKAKFPYQKHQAFDGKITQIESSSPDDFTLQVKLPELNPDTVNRLAQLELQLGQQQLNFARATNFQGKQSALNSMQQTQLQYFQAAQNLYRAKDVDVKLRAAEKVHVRWNYPPPDYDDKGNLKKYTKDELKALRGDEGFPGYKAEREALQKGQYVRVYLAKKIGSTAKGYKMPKGFKGYTKKGKKGLPAAPSITADDVASVQDRPEVIVILILAEPKQQ